MDLNPEPGTWIDKINSKDLDFGKPGWFDELLSALPYREHTNFIIDPELLRKMDVVKKDIQETQEKVYAFACFLPPGRSSAWVMYNSDSKSDAQRKKSICTLLMPAKPRAHDIDVKFRKVRSFKIQRKFHLQ